MSVEIRVVTSEPNRRAWELGATWRDMGGLLMVKRRSATRRYRKRRSTTRRYRKRRSTTRRYR